METFEFWMVIALAMTFSGWLMTQLPMLAIPLALLWLWLGSIIVLAALAGIAERWRNRV